MNSVPSGERIHIGFFGKRNAGKSSLVNAVLGQDLSIVSDVAGTTTDPVKKAMELLPLGPVVIIDTPGLDDEGELGHKRVEKTRDILSQCDVAVIVVDVTTRPGKLEEELIVELKKRNIPYILVLNKMDMLSRQGFLGLKDYKEDHILVSACDKASIERLKEKIIEITPRNKEKYIVCDLVNEGDSVVLVIPIDEAAPKGRIILPQQLVLRELLDKKCNAICCQVHTLSGVLENLKTPPSLVITDSQAFKEVAHIVPSTVRLTSFSVLMARYKGDMELLLTGASAIDLLEDHDRILVAEACTHHRQCNDIGTVKIPTLLKKYTGKELEFSFSSGGEFPDDISDFKLIVHCGGCMINEASMKARMDKARESKVPMVNYGMLFAKINGILERISNIL